MSWSDRLSVRGKLLLMLALPMAGYAFFNLHDTWGNYQELRAAGLVEQGLDMAQPLWRSFVFNIAASFVVWIVTFLVVYRLSLRITQPLKALAEGLQRSDLTLQLAVASEDEVGQAAAAFNAYNSRLRTIFRDLTGSSGSVASGATQLSASSEQMAATSSSLAQNSEAQRAAFERVAAAVTELSASIEQVSGNIRRSQQESEAAVAAVNLGSGAGRESAKAMEDIRTVAATMVTAVRLIQDIARQTNLLSLNAAIEAAKAGAMGKGFAVVAEEVRKLAEQSQEAAKKIADLIGEIQGDTDKAVVAMSDGTREVKTGAEVVNAAGAAFREIVDLVSQVSGQVREISAAVQQMAGGSQQIVGSVRKIDALSKKAAGESQSVSAAAEEQLASMEEISSSSQALATLAQDLQNAVTRFRL